MSYEGHPTMSALEIFEPTGATSRAFRSALGRFGTGVTVVTTASKNGPMGFTANSFASVSLDPPLVLWCPARASSRFEEYTDGSPFAIHVLGEAQEDLADAFVKEPDAFDGLDWYADQDGTPIINDAIARFSCTSHAYHDGGDHIIAVGLVREVALRAGAPLLFSSGGYGSFTAR
ncbi:MAG: flavin reductase family protein [Pseudomonadota bacterium]